MTNLNYLLEKPVTDIDEFIDDKIKEKTVVIKNIIDILGFNLKDLSIRINKDQFYINVEKLLTDSDFSKGYENIRMMFGKPKKELNNKIKGSSLIKFLDSYLCDMGICVNVIKKQKWINNKNITTSLFILKIEDIFISNIKSNTV
jgi:hypothetical protein